MTDREREADILMKKFVRVIKWCLVLALAGSLLVIGRQTYDSWRNEQASAEAAQIAGLSESGRAAPSRPPASEDAPLPDPLPDEASALAEIDLAALQAVNGDVAGWIMIPGTELSYPVMQGEDNQYYLSRSWKGEANASGSVFLESTCDKALTDFHTIVYAHRMRNDTMFGTLKYYNTLDFWQKHPSVYVAAENGDIYRYDIFAAHEVSTKGIIYRLDIEESRLEDELIRACLENSAIDTEIVPTGEDRLLTLSTCTATGRVDRWVVHAVLRAQYKSAR